MPGVYVALLKDGSYTLVHVTEDVNLVYDLKSHKLITNQIDRLTNAIFDLKMADTVLEYKQLHGDEK